MNDSRSNSNPPSLTRRQRAAGWLTGAAMLIIVVAAASHYWRGEPALEIETAAPRDAVFRLDLNDSPQSELMLLPGVGEKLSSRIVAARDAGDVFATLDDLQRVKGIGPKRAAALAPYVKQQ